jgi:endonuclease/exonuclease/phosphatase family metal-dependent hydrolase
MKKNLIFYFIILLILIISCNEEDDKYNQSVSDIKLATWNIRYLSTVSRDDAELSQIADILKRYDLIAIQESRDTTVLSRLENIMPGYDYLAFDPVGATQKEIYTYFYKTAVISPIDISYLFPDPNDYFIREPYVASFKAGNFDFTLVTIHVLYRDSEAERREEIKLLDDVLAQVDIDNGIENDTIRLGDFNFDRGDFGWQITTHYAVVSPEQKTTITDTSSYDNIWINPEETKKYDDNLEIYRFDEIMFDNKDDEASLAVSDHRPVSVIFRTNQPDDD